MNVNDSVPRHFGLDWLRIGAFALLIAYHIAMYVGPLHWVVKSAHASDWLAYPLNAISPWRLMVLFAVSGYASAAMLGKFSAASGFFRERSKRLLLPLLFGVLILVPPQSWVREIQTGFVRPYPDFWLHDYFSFRPVHGFTLPHWEHLWFLGYLWAYTLLLVAGVSLIADWRGKASRVGKWLAAEHRLLLLPILLIALARLLLVKEGFAAHGMFDDLIGDIHYLPAFLFGFLLAFEPALWKAISRLWRMAAMLSLAALAIIFFATWQVQAGISQSDAMLVIENIADTVMAWAMIPVAFHLADIALNRDHRWRAKLAEAVFPAYLVHQTIIVLLGLYLLRFNLPNGVLFMLIGSAVVAGSALAYELAKRIGPLGIVLGVTSRADRQGTQCPAVSRAF